MPRISADLPQQTYELLEALTEDQERTKTEVLRRAVELEKTFQDILQDGDRVVVEKSDGTRIVLVRP